jgi:hypothetical protein
MNSVIFTGIINESYAKLIALISSDLYSQSRIIVVGLRNDEILKELSEIKTLVFLDYNQFYYPQSIQISNGDESNLKFDDETYHLISDSFIRLFPYYWRKKDIKNVFLKLTSYWTTVIEDYNVEKLINLSSVPHFPSELILEKLASIKKIHIVNFWFTGIEGYVHLASSIYNDLLSYNHGHSQLMKSVDYQDFLEILENYRTIKETSVVTPKYKTQKKNSNFKNKIQHLLKIIIYYGLFTTIFQLIRIKFIQSYNYLDNISKIETKELPDKYIYFPLHYQPEATSLPLAGQYRDQKKILKVIRNLFPDIIIVIKEHPVQNNYGRSKEFLEFLKNESMISVIKNNVYTTDQLIKNSSIVISATGTSLFEAYLYDKPAIMFGNNIYKLLPNVTHVESLTEVNSYGEGIILSESFCNNKTFTDFIKKNGVKSNLLLKNNNVNHYEIYETFLQLRKVL